MKKYLLLLLCLPFCLVAQEEGYVPQQFLLQLEAQQSIQRISQQLARNYPELDWQKPERLIPNMDLWKLKYEGAGVDDAVVLDYLKGLATVQEAQFDHYITFRDAPQATTPNDPAFGSQWQYINTGAGGGTAGVDLDADLAWDVTTGGLSARNDTIVVAIIDDGISLIHSDLTPNRWVNRAEIPNNGIDDDNNGYVDDYQGWNTTTETDYITGGGHGSQVAGIIGAKGNNTIGVTGVNWNIKMMIINSSFNTTESIVLAAYGYALTQRKIYNETNGQEGAYVVATNASWGINAGQASNYPLWCAFYDTLGAYGILNVGATANNNMDVDLVGDMPTTCPSDYLLGVTNINKQGKKSIAAWGATHIDLGAFGEGVYTTRAPSGYGLFGGTSAATPHVTGAIALLYAGACANFIDYSRVYPDSAALKMRDYILNGVVPNIDMAGRTTSGGYLNLNNSMNLCVNDCPSTACFAPYNITVSNVLDTTATIDYVTTTAINQLRYRYRELGGLWSSPVTIPAGPTLNLTNLNACTSYEVELGAVCNGNTGETTVFSFKTDGCCVPPSNLTLVMATTDSAQITWDAVLAANVYLINYKESGASTWTTLATSNNQFWLENLQSCMYYDVVVQTICNNGDTTNFSNTLGFLTLGCTSCANVTYCAASGQDASNDWIERFGIDFYENISGNNGGYALFDSVQIIIGKGNYHTISVTQGKNYIEFVTVWLDINQDGDFSDPDEEIFNTIFAVTDTTKTGHIIVPSTALLGTTRMRAAMRWNRLAPVCGSYDYGEVEDYCVQIINGNSITQLPTDIETFQVYPNPFQQQINIDIDVKKAMNTSVELYTITGQQLYQQAYSLATGEQQVSIRKDLPAGIYLLKMTTPEGQLVEKLIKH